MEKIIKKTPKNKIPYSRLWIRVPRFWWTFFIRVIKATRLVCTRWRRMLWFWCMRWSYEVHRCSTVRHGNVVLSACWKSGTICFWSKRRLAATTSRSGCAILTREESWQWGDDELTREESWRRRETRDAATSWRECVLCLLTSAETRYCALYSARTVYCIVLLYPTSAFIRTTDTYGVQFTTTYLLGLMRLKPNLFPLRYSFQLSALVPY